MGSNVKVSGNNVINGTVHTLKSIKDFVLHLYIYEGSSLIPTQTKVEIEIPQVNKIVETDDIFMFYRFDSLVGEFSKSNVIGFVEK